MAFTLIAIIFSALLIAGTIKEAIGAGLQTNAIAILGTGVGLCDAIPLLILPSLIANLWQVLRGGELLSLLKRFGCSTLSLASESGSAR